MNEELIKAAYEAAKNAYTPYSHFNVGAAILTSTGKIYTGCNVENASYGAAICAERTAAVKAVSDGEISFSKIAVVSLSRIYTYPCGICRQFLSEFMQEDSKLILHDEKEGILEYNFFEMIPHSFKKDDIR